MELARLYPDMVDVYLGGLQPEDIKNTELRVMLPRMADIWGKDTEKPYAGNAA